MNVRDKYRYRSSRGNALYDAKPVYKKMIDSLREYADSRIDPLTKDDILGFKNLLLFWRSNLKAMKPIGTMVHYQDGIRIMKLSGDREHYTPTDSTGAIRKDLYSLDETRDMFRDIIEAVYNYIRRENYAPHFVDGIMKVAVQECLLYATYTIDDSLKGKVRPLTLSFA